MDVKQIYPFHFETFKQEYLDGRWSQERMLIEFREFLLNEMGFDNRGQIYSLSDAMILKGLGVI